MTNRTLRSGRWMSWTLSCFLSAPAIALADLIPPRVSFTLEQAARQTIAKYDLIVEAEVGSISTVPLNNSENQVGVLTLRYVRSIWGRVMDPTIEVHSRINPEGRNDLMIAPLPTIHSKGIFLLICDSRDHRMISGNVPTL